MARPFRRSAVAQRRRARLDRDHSLHRNAQLRSARDGGVAHLSRAARRADVAGRVRGVADGPAGVSGLRVAVFDAYGTLFDVSAAAREAAAAPGGEALAAVWPTLAEVWRRKQLEYSWIRSLSGAHADFWTVTCDALDYAMAATGVESDALRDRLQALYRDLRAYPEVPETLAALRAAGLRTAILSNGSPEMLARAVAAAGIGAALDAVLSAEAVGVFKTDPRVYALVGATFGVAPAEALFVSSNGWDAAAAAGYGFRTLWVNRRGDPVDRLPWRPDHVGADLSAAVAVARAPGR
ncbi:MAG: haloacid dehalogenase type II [Rhodobacteraceae bacterium]|nr:MAG: haloacid dehalogenase type II [Paracoccaceae bacterium]